MKRELLKADPVVIEMLRRKGRLHKILVAAEMPKDLDNFTRNLQQRFRVARARVTLAL